MWMLDKQKEKQPPKKPPKINIEIRNIEAFFNDPANTEIYTLSLLAALPISRAP